MNRGSTGMNRGSIGDDRDEPGKTGAPPGNYGNAPVNAVRVPKTGALSERHRHSPGLGRGITGDDRGKTGALPHGDCRRCYGIPGLCRLSAGLNQSSTGDNRVYAGTLPAFTGALPATTGALPGLHRDKPLPARVDRNSAGLLTGFNRDVTGKYCDCVKKIYESSRSSPVDRRLYQQK
ncbi:hypothetical protein DPMN_040859 [Dreissena polymorpha]|uniref:Uncharacterized protein n=1 Tax=Dreissena polymorpha TaxID=45954 RepID=A0A9D4CYE6_DREPO|nr:hypothetical protein DPMN_040859 [Dreissena polymorpha]